MNHQKPIKAVIINLSSRTDRRAHVLKEFEGRTEFEVVVVNAIEDPRGAKGLWQTLQHILRTYATREACIIVCEDDHRFTSHYNARVFLSLISEAMQNGADVLSGGVSWLNSAVQISPHIYWTEKFSGLQFTVIFRKAYDKILNAHFSETDVADFKICSITENKYFIYPFISNQKEFGYSDVTFKNGVWGTVDELFRKSEANVATLEDIVRFYSRMKEQPIPEELITTTCISTYITGATNSHVAIYIEENFIDRPELQPVFLPVNRGQQGHILSSVGVLKTAAAKAIADEEDVVIVCDEFHRFTPSFSAHYLIKNILEAFTQGVEVLFGGGEDFGLVVPIAENRFWVSSVKEPHFIVLFKTSFSKILKMADDSTDTGDDILSGLSSNKMILCPFVSVGSQNARRRLSVVRDRHERLRAGNPVNTGIVAYIHDISDHVVCREGCSLIYSHSSHHEVCICFIHDPDILKCDIDFRHPMHFIVLGTGARLADWGIPAEMITDYPFLEAFTATDVQSDRPDARKIFYILEDITDDPCFEISLSVIKAFNCLLHLPFCVIAPQAAIDKLTSVANDNITFLRSTGNYSSYLSECKLLVASGGTAVKALLYGIPVIVAGRYGFGGLVTEDNWASFVSSHFLGRPGEHPGERISTVGRAQEIIYTLEIIGTPEWTHLSDISAANRERLKTYCLDAALTLARQQLAEKELLARYIDDSVLALQLKPVLSLSFQADERTEFSSRTYWLRNINTNKVLAVVSDDEMRLIHECDGRNSLLELVQNLGADYGTGDCIAFIRSLWELRIIMLNI